MTPEAKIMMEEKAETDLETGQEGQVDLMIDTDQVPDQEIDTEAEVILEIDQPQEIDTIDMIEMVITEMIEITDPEMVDMTLNMILEITEIIDLIPGLIEKAIGKEQTIHIVLVVAVINKVIIHKTNSLTETDHSEVALLALTDLTDFRS